MLKNGLYEQVINREIERELDSPDIVSATEPIDSAESSVVLAKYLSDVIRQGLDNISDNGGSIDNKIEFVNKIVNAVASETDDDNFNEQSVSQKAEQLLAVYEKRNSILAVDEKTGIVRPKTSIAQSSLFTGAIHEPQMFTELKKEILSCSSIDMLVSFIKWSGLRLIIDELEKFTQNGGALRIITTSYMGATDVKAVERLNELPNTKIKISYDTKRTRLHAKTYVFFRDTGFTTAYVGSSNLSNAAMTSGCEWNVKVTQKDQSDTLKKIEATFDSYWNSNEFEFYDSQQKDRLAIALKSEKYHDTGDGVQFTLDLRPYSYQQEILDKLAAERSVRNSFCNLVVAATGTGKTVISAFDYLRFRKNNPGKPCRLLFVAHREEILKQSLYTFRAVLKDANFGDMYVGSFKPDSIDNLFISIQTFNSQDFTTKTTEDFYDYIVIDEFHHAAAPTYQRLLEYYKSKIMLGLTATPERMDGKNILKYFGNRIAAQIRLPEAIDRKLLCPFQYFGVTDNVDLQSLKWSAGGYDKNALSDVYTISGEVAKKRADLIVASLIKYITDIDSVKGLGFCVTVAHAEFMSDYFNSRGIPSIFLTGKTPEQERNEAKKLLTGGKVRFIFVVDIYNEGVDIPEVNTILFLRPTESITVFLQQLGRGLRLCDDKECLTVLDFIGQANKKYRFEEKFAALLSNTNHSVVQEIKAGFAAAPKGCYIQLERIAAKYILDNIKASYGNTAGMVSALMTFSDDTGMEATMANFLDYYHIDVRSMYKYSTFSRLKVRAGLSDNYIESADDFIDKALLRLCTIDSRRWILFLLDVLPKLGSVDVNTFSDIEQRMMQMFYVTMWLKTAENWNDKEVVTNLKMLADSPNAIVEITELLKYKYDQIDFIDEPVDVGFDCPLDLHCTYTRDQILVAMDFMKPSTVREGCKWLPDKKTDIFFVTLNKSDKDYSPTTMYNDYSINDILFHWQSQSTTSVDSPTGQRYIRHRTLGSRILMFVREFKTDSLSNSAAAYTYLGTANYVEHTGSRPINITWKLDRPIPAKYLKKTNKLVVG